MAAPDARSICIETDPDFIAAARNVTENGRSNIRIIHCRAGPIDDPQVSFYRVPEENSVWRSVGPQFTASPVALAQRRLDVEWNYDSAFEPVMSALLHG